MGYQVVPAESVVIPEEVQKRGGEKQLEGSIEMRLYL